MTLRNTFRVLLLKWYITIPGLLLSLALAGATFALAPPQYSSNAIAVLVQPKLVNKNAPTNSNPLLNFDNSLSTTALILVQALDTPEAAASIGLYPGGDSYTIKDVGDLTVGDQIVQPFLYIKSEASTPDGAAAIVDGVLGMAAQDLLDRQRSLKVLPQNSVQLNLVVPPSPPQPVLGIAIGATAAALLLGIIGTVGCAMWAERRSVARQARRASEPAEQVGSNGSAGPVDGTKVGTQLDGNNGHNGHKFAEPATAEPATAEPATAEQATADHGPGGKNGHHGSRTLVTSPADPVLATGAFSPGIKPSSNGTGRQ